MAANILPSDNEHLRPFEGKLYGDLGLTQLNQIWSYANIGTAPYLLHEID